MSPVSTTNPALFQFQKIEMDYDPYPIGYVPQIFPPEVYAELARTYPALDLFAFMPKLGLKYSLSQVNNPEQYHRFIESTPAWKQLYDEVKSPHFVSQVIDSLSDAKVDVGLRGCYEVTNAKKDGWARRLHKALSCLKNVHAGKVGIKTRFEFSVLPADGGHIKPHTDAANKVITLVVSCISDGEWDAAHGGGTAVLRPKDVTENYNHNNRYLDFDATETIKTFPFVPNQCVVFVKTFNSLHAVHPMTGAQSVVLRKTLTINLELDTA
jgi:hypothetical protein